MPFTLTGLPDRSVGENFEARAACSAEERRSGCPKTADAEMTLPFSSTLTRTLTAPLARTALAAAGYGDKARNFARETR